MNQKHEQVLSVSPSNPLKVAFYLFFPGSGIGRYTHDLLTHLTQSSEISAELACVPSYHWKDQAVYPVWPGLKEIGHPQPWRRRLRFLVAQVANPWRICKRLRDTESDIVHFSNVNHLSFPLWKGILKRTGAKVAVTVHDVRRAKGILNHRYETHQLQDFYRTADALFVHSGSQADDLADFAHVDVKRIHIVPHGPYQYGPPSTDRCTLRQRYNLPEGKQIALFFGNIRDEKNLDSLLGVLPHFRESLHLIVAGRGGGSGHRKLEYYRTKIDQLSINNMVTFMDRYIDDSEVADLFTVCDWVALPYQSTFTSQSGVLNVAAAYERPVLVSPAPTFLETLDQCDIGVSMESESDEGLIESIAQLQSRLETAYQHQFRQYVEQFGWEENARRTLQVYQSLSRPSGRVSESTT